MLSLSKHERIPHPHSFGEHSKPRSPFDWAQGERGLECSTDFSRMHNPRHHHGFTLIELVMVIVILGIISAAALPKFFDVSVFQERAFYDDTSSALRYAQKLAVATGCNVQVSIASNTFSLKRPSAVDRSQCKSTTSVDFTRDVAHPGTGQTPYSGSQSGISLSSATFYFNALGTASTGLVINVGSTKQITVIQETGFVYDSTP